MTELTPQETLNRIKIAPEDSPLLLMRSEKKGYINSAFANTVFSQQLIRSNHPDILGVFHKNSDCTLVKVALMKAEEAKK